MATGTLTGQTIASTYKSLLKITGTTAGGETLHATTLKVIEDGDGNPFPFSAAADAIMINSTNRLEFGDNASYIHQSADGVLDLVSDTEIELTATTIDINGAVDMSSTLSVTAGVTINEGGGDNDFRVETTGNTHGFHIDAGSNIVNIQRPISANDASAPDEVLALKTFYPASGTDGAAGAGPLLSFYIPDDETNPILGAGIGGLKESANDSDASTALAFYTSQDDATLDEAMRITSTGNVGIGENAPGSPLDVKSGLAANTANFNSTNGATNITLESSGTLIGQFEFASGGDCAILTRTASAPLILGSNNVKTLYITDDDNVGIGIASPATKLHIKGADPHIRLEDSSPAEYWNISIGQAADGRLVIDDTDNDNGVFMNQNDTSWSGVSDERFKTNWTAFDDALSSINSLTKVGTFQYTKSIEDQTPKNNTVHSGLSAQEVQKFLPGSVSEDNDGVLGLQYQHLIPVLIKAVQELSAKVETLENA